VIRDNPTQIDGDEALKAPSPPAHSGDAGARSAPAQRGKKVYSLQRAGGGVHRQGQGRKPYEFGVRSPWHAAEPLQGWPVRRPHQGPPGAPHDGHTLATVLPEIEARSAWALKRILADACIVATTPPQAPAQGLHLRQKRGVTEADQALLRRRAAVESSDTSRPNTEWAETISSTAPATPSTPSSRRAGYNFRLLILWLRHLLAQILAALSPQDQASSNRWPLDQRSSRRLNDEHPAL